MLVLTDKISAEAQRLWRRLQAGKIEHWQLMRAAMLRDLPAIATLGQEPAASCGINNLQERSWQWGAEFSTHTAVFIAVCVSDLIECNHNCSLELVRALDQIEIWQRHPNRHTRNNVQHAYKKAKTSFRRASRGMDMSGYSDRSATTFGYSVVVLEMAMEAIIRQPCELSMHCCFEYAVRARKAQVEGMVNHPNRTARRAVARHVRLELANWVLSRDYDWRFLVSSSP